jgi:hypothetical protein
MLGNDRLVSRVTIEEKAVSGSQRESGAGDGEVNL